MGRLGTAVTQSSSPAGRNETEPCENNSGARRGPEDPADLILILILALADL